MTVIKSHLILGTLFIALIGTTLAVSATCSQAGLENGGGVSSVTGQDLGSSR